MSSTKLPLLIEYYDVILVQQRSPIALGWWTDDAVVHFPGNNPFSGRHVGVSWVMNTYFPTIRKLADIRKEVLLSPLVADAEYGLSHYTERITIHATGEELAMRRRALYRFDGNRIAEVRVFDEDSENIDRFLNRFW